jgi:hypothetical protein
MTTQQHHLHIAAADGAPGFDVLAKDIIQEFGMADEHVHALEPVVVDDYNTDWDHLYPFSAVRLVLHDELSLILTWSPSFSRLIRHLWLLSQITSAHGPRNKYFE